MAAGRAAGAGAWVVGLLRGGSRGCEGARGGTSEHWDGAVWEVGKELRRRAGLVGNGGDWACMMGRLGAAPKSNTASATAIAMEYTAGATANVISTAPASVAAAANATATAPAPATSFMMW